MSEEHKPWHDGVHFQDPKDPDPNHRECCKSVLFGGLQELMCEVHNDLWDGIYKLKVNFCPHCGRDMKKVRAEAIEELQNDYGNPANYLQMRHHDHHFPGRAGTA